MADLERPFSKSELWCVYCSAFPAGLFLWVKKEEYRVSKYTGYFLAGGTGLEAFVIDFSKEVQDYARTLDYARRIGHCPG